MPEHVGIPIAEQSENSYYMLEVHYNNPMLKNVNDSSGVRLHLTEKLRPQEAGILVTGVAVSPLHLIPPQRKEYATVGYCTSACTQIVIEELYDIKSFTYSNKHKIEFVEEIKIISNVVSDVS